jgi:hypothetical protein
MVYGNLAIQVKSQGAQHSDLQTVSQAIATYMKPYEASSPVEQNLPSIDFPSTVNVKENFDIEISVSCLYSSEHFRR